MSFVPKGQEGLLIRSPLTNGFISPSSFYQPKSIYTKDTANTQVLGQKEQQVLMKDYHIRNFYTRNNPHPFRVHHMKGLLDVPICCVEDQVEPRYLLSPPTGRDFGSAFRPKGSTRYSANVNKGVPALGVVPVTMAWRDELERKAQNAMMKAMGQSPTFKGGLDNQAEVRKGNNQFEDLCDDKLLEWLCRILLTNSIPTCQAWLSTAAESEKAIVLNMIKMVACGELKETSMFTSPRPQTPESQTHYVWYPEKSKPKRFQPSNKNGTIYEEEEFSFPSLKKVDKTEMEALPPDFPRNDNVIRMALNLSQQASKERYRAGPGMLGQPSKEVEKKEQLAKSQDKMTKHPHRRSASVTTPTASGHARSAVTRSPALQRIKSMTFPSGGANKNVHRPQPPVKVCVTKETLHPGSSGSARLRYTSHWDQ